MYFSLSHLGYSYADVSRLLFTNCCLLQYYTTITPQDGGWVRVTFTKSYPEAAFEDYCLCTGEVLKFRFRFISLFSNQFINIGGCQDWWISGEDKKSCSCLELAYTCTCSLNKLFGRICAFLAFGGRHIAYCCMEFIQFDNMMFQKKAYNMIFQKIACNKVELNIN